MTKILDWKRAEDPRDVIHLAVQALAEGHIVAFPSDVHYVMVASGLRPTAVDSLCSIVHCDNQKIYPSISLLPRSADEILDYVPDVSQVAHRLAIRNWPGPFELLVKNGHPNSLAAQLVQSAQDRLYNASGYLCLNIPKHKALEQVVRLSAGPLLVSAALQDKSQSVATSFEQISNRVAFIIDDGATLSPSQTTIVRVDGANCKVEREGQLTEEQLVTMSQFVIVLVCTGNTCRSPMAEAMMNTKLQTRFAKHFQNAQFAPIVARSAGVAAEYGVPASQGAVASMAKSGLDLRNHQSQPAQPELMDRADLILTMTSSHRQNLLSRWPNLAGKTFGLAPDEMDVSDPYGGSVEVYQACAKKIDQYLDAWIVKLDEQILPIWSSERK
ncbi:MAG: Sua5/YciO/YrdC/YwlC family protein [Pirellulaceae bacterium]|nr:Sua5/YciO/YrdC/YwlC family protein [Pirellulaceae bacterium]